MFGVLKRSESIVIENKSKFVGILIPVDNEKEFDKCLLKIKEEYKTATHITFAYSINCVEKAFDANEPTYTAGLSILNQIKKYQLKNVVLFVVRYFGGIKLGKSKLRQTYSKCAEDTIKNAELIEFVRTINCTISGSVSDVAKCVKTLQSLDIKIKYLDANTIRCKVQSEFEKFRNYIGSLNILEIEEIEELKCQ